MHVMMYTFCYLLLDGKLAPKMRKQAVEKPEDIISNAGARCDTNSVVNSSLITDVRHSLNNNIVKYLHEY